LLRHGAGVNDVTGDSLTALWFAIPNGEKTRLLLDHGANPGLYSKEGVTPLVKLVHFPNALPLLRLMMAHGADPLHASHDNMLLYEAAASGDTARVGTLLRMGLPVNDTVLYGDYPINQSMCYRSFDVLKMLVAHGAWVNVALPH